MKEIYLDHSATTPTSPEVLEAMKPYFSEKYGNPSSLYSISKTTRQAISKARNTIADSIGAEDDEIIFTSGGTESNNFAIKGVAFANKSKGDHIITSSIEHHAGIRPCKFLEDLGYDVSYISVDEDGIVDIDELKDSIRDDTILISIMYANNEIGTIQPIETIGEIADENDIYFHTDAVQAYGHLPIDVNESNIDLLSMSAHKLYGPKGTGALYKRKGVNIEPLLHGGDQENKLRASTENIAGIVGFGKASELAFGNLEEEKERQSQLRDLLIQNIMNDIKDVQLNGHPEKRLPNNVNVVFKGIEGESIVLNLDMEGIYGSTGSACSSETLEPSHVLLETGLEPSLAHGSLRLTLGKATTKEDIDYVSDKLPGIIQKLRKMSPMY